MHSHINFMSFSQSAEGVTSGIFLQKKERFRTDPGQDRDKSRNDGVRLTKVAVLLILYFLLSAVCMVHAAQKDDKELVALFPFANLSEDRDALAAVMPAVKRRLEASGFQVLDEEKLNNFLLKEKIRNTGYVSRDVAVRLGGELKVKAVLVGSVNSFFTGDDPRIGLSARLVNCSDGSILWAGHSSASGDDFTTILGLGTVTAMDRLSSRVVDQLFDSFRSAPANKEIESTYRIAVMPFQNGSKVKDAGLIATYLFIAGLFRDNKFIPIEYGEVRRLVVDLRVREKGELDFRRTEKISESSGVDGILVGTVDIYKEKDGTAPPEAEISARLIDARRDKILWCDTFRSKGDDDIIVFDWGRINTAENAAYKVVSKLLKEMGKARWN
jgi:TolB-like protein